MDEALTATVREAMPLAGHLGIEGVEASPEGVVLRGAWAPEHCTAAGILHGGYLMTLADMSAAMLAYLNVPAGGPITGRPITESVLGVIPSFGITYEF